MRFQRAGAEHGYVGSASALFSDTATDFGVRAENNLIFGTSSSERMRVATSSGHIGIGTTSPDVRLDIIGDTNGSVRIASNETDATAKAMNIILPEYTNASGNMLVVNGQTNASANEVRIGGGWSGYDAATVLRFYTASALNTDTGTQRMHIDGSGNVGIGVADPVSKLVLPNATSLAWKTTGSSGSEVTAIKSNSDQLEFTTNGLTRAVINSSGYFGIGNTSPAEKLHLGGGLRIEGSAQTFTQRGIIMDIETSDPTNTLGRFVVGESGTNSSTLLFYTSNGGSVGERLRITSAGNVGIGTSTPAAKLDLSGNIGFSGNSNVVIGRTVAQNPTPTSLTIRSNLNNTGASPNSGAHIVLYSGFNAGGDYGHIEYTTQSGGAAGSKSGDHIFYTGATSSTERMRIDINGNVGIGTTLPSEKLQVGGNIAPASDNANTCGTAGLRWTTVYATNGTINTSDRRLKNHVHPLTYGLKDLLKLRPVAFQWKDRPELGNKLGLIAQEVQEVLPEVVNEGNDEKKTLGLYYADLVPVLIKATQDQQGLIDKQNRKIEMLEREIEAMKKQQAQIAILLATLTPPSLVPQAGEGKKQGMSEE
jgi:hypothetical protein